MADETELRARIAALEAEVRELRKIESLPYKAIVEDMSELVVRWRPDGTRLFVNDAYCRMFSATRDTLLGTSFWPLVSNDDRAEVQARIAALRPEAPVSTGQHRALGPSGAFIWMEWVDRAVFDAGGEVIEIQSVGRDISERVRLEELARQVDRADAIARASAATAHDLRNILQVMMGASSQLSDLAAGRHEVETLSAALGQARNLLAQMEEVRHGVVLRPAPLELGALVRDLLDLLRQVAGARITVVKQLSALPAWIIGDSTQIDQILLNLVRNAAEAIQGKGCIVIATRVVDAEDLEPELRPPEAKRVALLEVSDTGPGIDPSVLPRIFDARVTTKPGGQGLGLATVKAIVEGHSGVISVGSTESGSTFRVAFHEAGA